MRPLRTALGFASAVLAVACGGESTSPKAPSYNVMFHQDSAQVYSSAPTTPWCEPANLGCMVWQKMAADTVGVMNVQDSTVKRSSETVTWAGTSSIHFDSTAIGFVGPQPCGILTIRATLSNGVVRGTWSQLLDCHGSRESVCSSGSDSSPTIHA